MASSNTPENEQFFYQQSYSPKTDSIENVQRFFKVNEKGAVGIDKVKKDLTELKPTRTFYITKSDNTVTDAKVHVSAAVERGYLVGVLKGVVLQKEANDLKKLEWPAYLINYVGQPKISGLPELISSDRLTLERTGRAKNQGTSVFVLQPEKQNNPLRHALFSSDPNKSYNSIAQFIIMDSHVFLCLIASKDIKEDDVIEAYSEDIQLYEPFGVWEARQRRKPDEPTKPGPSSVTKNVVPEMPQGSMEPRTRYQKKLSKEENGQEDGKENVPVERKTSGKKASKDKISKETSKDDTIKPIHKVIRQLKSQDDGISSDTKDNATITRTKKRSREEMRETTSDESSTKRVKSVENTSSASQSSFPEPSEMIKSTKEAGTSTEDDNDMNPKGRTLRPRKANDQGTEKPRPTRSTKKILTRTQSVPVERLNSDKGTSRKKKRSEDEDDEKKKEKGVKKIKSKETNDPKPKSNSAPQAVLKQKLGNIKLKTTTAAEHINAQVYPLRFRKPFENGRKFNLNHVGVLIHQTEEDKNNPSLIAKLELMRRTRIKKFEENFVKDWYSVFKGLFDCKDVSNIKNYGCEDIKNFLKKKKRECETDFRFIGNDEGVLFIMVFTSVFMNHLKIKLCCKEDPADLMTDILISVFEIEDRSAQRFFPLIILETSTGVRVWKQNGNKLSDFEYVRYSASAPNEAVLENHISMIIREFDKQLKNAYHDSTVQKTNLIKVLRQTQEEDYKTFLSTEYEVQKHKLCVEHSTTKPFLLKKPKDISKELEDDEVEGRFLLIQHCTDQGTDYNFEIMHNRLVKPMRYLKCERALSKISDYYDKGDSDIEKIHKKVDAGLAKTKQRIKIKTLKSLNKVKYVKASPGQWSDITSRFPALVKQPLRSLDCDEKYEISKKRRAEQMKEIQEVAKNAVKDKKPYLVLIIQCRGKYEYFWLGEIPPDDDVDFEKFVCRYEDIIDIVREAGIKKLFVISGHYCDQEEELPSNVYRGKYPRYTIGGTPSTYHIRLEKTRIENSIPQHSILWATPPGYQLPLSKNKKSSSPLLDQFKQLMMEWPDEEEVTLDKILQNANKISMQDPSGPESVVFKTDDADKKNPNFSTRTQFYLTSTMIFNHSWRIKRSNN